MTGGEGTSDTINGYIDVPESPTDTPTPPPPPPTDTPPPPTPTPPPPPPTVVILGPADGFAMASAPAIVTFVSGTPKDAINATLEMYEITYAEHKYFTMPPLDFRGTPTGIDIRKVVEKGITPRVNTGIAHRDAGVGQVGAGLVRPPMAMFEEAVVAFAEKYGY